MAYMNYDNKVKDDGRSLKESYIYIPIKEF